MATKKTTKPKTKDISKKVLEKAFENENFIKNVCLSYRHDFGLMDEEDKRKMIFECKHWMRAIVGNWDWRK